MLSGKTIAESADELGFTDRFHFTKVFRRIMGVSPGSLAKS